MNIERHELHHLMVRTKFSGKLKHYPLDTIIAVGHAGIGQTHGHAHTELFTLSSSKWQNKEDYLWVGDIYGHAIVAVEKSFILFGGWSRKRKVLTNQYIKSVHLESFIPLLL